MTGYTEEDLVRKAVSEGAYTCVYKPFNMEKLIELVERISREKKK
jgi:DNA-binding NtrC family response regulator